MATYADFNAPATYQFSFPSVKETDIKVYVDGTQKQSTTHYNISGYTPTGGGTVVFTSGNIPESPSKVHIARDTDINTARATYTAGSSVKAGDLNANNQQLLYATQEIEEDIDDLTVKQRFFTGTTPPSAPIDGAVWYESTTGRSFVYYKDADSSAWVEASPAYSGGSIFETDITSLTDANIAGNANIDGSKLKDDSIGMGKLASGTLPSDIVVNASNLAENSVDSSELVDGSVDNSHMSADSIDSDQYVDGSIEGVHLENGAITNAKVASDAAIDATKISYTNSATGGQTRTLDSRLDTVININDFIPTSVTDTSASNVNCATYINNAINALPSAGGKIIFPAGLYRITSAITITKHGVVLEGACGMGMQSPATGARFIRDDGDNNTYISISGGARSTQIRNLEFIGGTFNNMNTGGAGVKPTDGAIHVTGAPGMQEHIYENLTFTGISECMNFDGLSSSLIRNCKFRTIPEDADGSPIIYLHGSSLTDRMDQIRIIDCIIDGSPAPGLSTSTGLDGWSANTNYSLGNKVHNDGERIYEVIAPTSGTGTSAGSGGPTGTGQSITDNGVTWKWLGNKINHTVKGIVISGEANTIFISKTSVIRCKESFHTKSAWTGEFLYITASEAERALLAGFNLDGTKGYITIDNCFSSSNYGDGIHITNLPSSISIFSTNIRFNTGHGINLGDISTNSGNVSIVNPIISGNSGAGQNQKSGIFIKDGVNNVFISGGRSGGSDIYDDSSNSKQKYGIDISGNNHKRIRIIGVNVDKNSTGGIHWTNGGNNTAAASDNFIQYCPGYSTGQTTFP